jgi:glycosyltransferase involved in cell wall biosynthesis
VDLSAETPFVSVVIPCYNQGHFLAEAIESVRNQTYRQFEIIVVDDGSTDNSALTARKYGDLRYIWQTNQGLAAARNTGLRESKGEYLVFLDADDRLRPEALDTGLQCLRRHRECGFVFGRYILIAGNGTALQYYPPSWPTHDVYIALLHCNYIAMHATVMYRRDAIEFVGGFDPLLKASEDYDLYFRILQKYTAKDHDTVVAEYRQHTANMSREYARMLRSSITVLRSQRKYVKGNQRYIDAYKTGTTFWRKFYGDPLVEQVLSQLKNRQWRPAASGALVLFRYYPEGVMRCASRGIRKTARGLSRLIEKVAVAR